MQGWGIFPYVCSLKQHFKLGSFNSPVFSSSSRLMWSWSVFCLHYFTRTISNRSNAEYLCLVWVLSINWHCSSKLQPHLTFERDCHHTMLVPLQEPGGPVARIVSVWTNSLQNWSRVDSLSSCLPLQASFKSKLCNSGPCKVAFFPVIHLSLTDITMTMCGVWALRHLTITSSSH